MMVQASKLFQALLIAGLLSGCSAKLPLGSVVAVNAQYPISADEQKHFHDMGWWVCDGTAINDSNSPLNGQSTPNLAGQFLIGAASNLVPGSSVITIPAQNNVPVVADWFTTPKQDFGPALGPGAGSPWGKFQRLTSIATIPQQQIPYLPPYHAVVYVELVK
jgi:hypothetical protein